MNKFLCFHTITIETVIEVTANDVDEAQTIGRQYRDDPTENIEGVTEWRERRFIRTSTTVLGRKHDSTT